MSDGRENPEDRTATQLELEPLETVDPRLPGLTILYHPELRRVGERAWLDGVEEGGRGISRLEPLFTAPREPSPRALDDPRLSRQPVKIFAAGAGGDLCIDPAGSPIRVQVEGEPLTTAITIPLGDLEKGVVLELAGSVVLLLHRLDPTADSKPDGGLLGESPGMVRLRRRIAQVADLTVPVLLRGATGTGKELVARAIHRSGPRGEGPFVAVNLAALPSALAAAELFGAVRGAFTGAEHNRMGYFRRAHGGTLFLDEIGEATVDVQVLLLRALEEGAVRPIGSEEPHPVNVRVVSATDVDLEQAVADGRFRAPLLYRLSGFTLRLPPLADRREDFGRLLVHFLRQEMDALGEAHRLVCGPGERPFLPAAVVAQLACRPWPGNVRQLHNAVRQLVIAHRGTERIEAASILELLEEVGEQQENSSPAVGRRPADISETELKQVLQSCGYRLATAARRLGISRASLYDLIDRSPSLRKASDLGRSEIERCLERFGNDPSVLSSHLEVSEAGLRRRLRQLGLV